MHKYLDNFNRLFDEDDNIVYQAILEKKDWILVPLYLQGDLSISLDANGQKHFYFLESLFDDTIIFKKLETLQDNNFRYAKFKTKIDNQALFYIEYDFRLIDDKGYQSLVANFYPCLSKKDLNINEESTEVKEILKQYMIGQEDERVIILDKNALLNERFFAPVIKRILVQKKAPQEVREVLEALANEKKIEIKEI